MSNPIEAFEGTICDQMMIKELYSIESYRKYKPFIILEGYRGSQAHGTYVPQNPDSVDDVDLMSIVAMPIEYYVGLKSFEVQEIKSGKWDIVIYDIKKFISLLLKQNPNVACLLWLEPTHYMIRSELGEKLIKNRKIFSSKKAHTSFVDMYRRKRKTLQDRDSTPTNP